MSPSIVWIWRDASTDGECTGATQGAGNTPSVVLAMTWLGTCYLISNYVVAQTNTTFLRVMGNIGWIVTNDCPNHHTNPSTLISMCHICHQCSKHKNASSDEKFGIEIKMLNTRYARISLETMCNNDIIPDIIHFIN